MSADLKYVVIILFLQKQTYIILLYITYRLFRKLGAVQGAEKKAAAARVS